MDFIRIMGQVGPITSSWVEDNGTTTDRSFLNKLSTKYWSIEDDDRNYALCLNAGCQDD